MLVGLLAVAALAYALLVALAFAFQRNLVYFPGYTRVDAAGTDFALDRGDAVLRGWVVNPGKPSAIVYFGGNAEAVQANRDDFSRWFPGRSVYLLAYRGYGASDGAPTSEALLADALALFDEAQARHPGQPVSVVGRSLGSGIASHVASRRHVDRLALVTPFDSLANVAQAHYPWLPVRWLLRDGYPSAEWLQGFRGETLVLRGGRDEVIPAANTDALVATLPPASTRVVIIAEAGHNDIGAFPAFGDALAGFMR